MSDHESETEEQQELDLTKVCLEAPLLPDRRPHTQTIQRDLCAAVRRCYQIQSCSKDH